MLSFLYDLNPLIMENADGHSLPILQIGSKIKNKKPDECIPTHSNAFLDILWISAAF